MNNWKLTPEQIEDLAPKATAYAAGKKLSNTLKWESYAKSPRALWGLIKGSGKKPYATQIDIQELAFKCSCPSRQFPCKHALALLILNSNEDLTPDSEEPEWVSEWIDKRRNKAKPKPAKDKTAEEIEKSEAGKQKRQDERKALVDDGVKELERWLEDMMRAGLLELPGKPQSYYSDMAARMVDAKANGLAGWVKALAKLDYTHIDTWHTQAVQIIGKLNLLIQSWKNVDQLSEDWQITLKNLMGWSQSSKELMQDKDARCIKDQWIILGQEKEVIEDITVLRSWLYGQKHQQRALILNFGTRHSPLENSLIAGTVMEAELAYFPSITPQRAIVKMVKEQLANQDLNMEPLSDLTAMQDAYNELCKTNPWYNNSVHIVNNCQLITIEEKWHLIDQKQQTIPVHSSFGKEQCMQWVLLTGNAVTAASMVLKNGTVLPLGIYKQGKYFSI